MAYHLLRKGIVDIENRWNAFDDSICDVDSVFVYNGLAFVRHPAIIWSN